MPALLLRSAWMKRGGFSCDRLIENSFRFLAKSVSSFHSSNALLGSVTGGGTREKLTNNVVKLVFSATTDTFSAIRFLDSYVTTI